MEPPVGRKARPLVLECLEPRRLLSVVNPPPDCYAGSTHLAGTSEQPIAPRDPAPGPAVEFRTGPMMGGGSLGSGTSDGAGCAPVTMTPSIATPLAARGLPVDRVAPPVPGGDLPGGVAPLNVARLVDHARDHAEAVAASAGSDARGPAGGGSGGSINLLASAVSLVRSASSGPADRAGGETLLLARATAATVPAPPVHDPALPEPALTWTVVASAGSGPVAAGPEHAVGPAVNLAGQRLPTGPPGMTIVAGNEPGSPETPAAVHPARGPDRTLESVRSLGRAVLISDQPVEGHDVPDPEVAGLITSFLPCSRASLDYAIDQLLNPLDEIGSALPEVPESFGLIPSSLAVAVSILALDVALRVRGPKGKPIGVDRDSGLLAFPGLPGLWRWSHR